VQRVHPAQRGVERDASGQIQRRAKRELLLRISGLVDGMAEINLARLNAQVFLEQVIAALQPPPGEHLIGNAEFGA